METVNSSSRRLKKAYHVEEAADLSAFRRRNRILIFVLFFLILSLTVVVGVLIAYLHHDFRPHRSDINPALNAYCAVAFDYVSCFTAFTHRFPPKSPVHPDDIFIYSLQTAADKLDRFVTHLSKIGDEDNESMADLIRSCSNSSIDALNQISSALAAVRADPAPSNDRRAEVGDRIAAAADSLRTCLVGGWKSAWEVRDNAVEVEAYLEGGAAFERRYCDVLTMFHSQNYYSIVEYGRGYVETLFGINMVGLQIVYMFFMFYCLFRIR